MEANVVCPFCGSRNVDVWATDLFECNDCKECFGYDDMEHELLRQKISSICSALEATEGSPIRCVREDAAELRIDGIDEETQGLAEVCKPQVSTLFQDSEGIVWLTLVEHPSSKPACDSEPIELDSINVNDSLKEILSWLEENTRVDAVGAQTDNTNTYYAFMWGEGNVEPVEMTPEEFAECKSNGDSVFETREQAERFAMGE